MPPRSVTGAIVVFWLAVAGLFLYQDVWPRFRPAEPELFPIDLITEAGRQSDPTSWSVSRNGGEVYVASTDWRYRADADTFESLGQLWRKEFTVPEPIRAEMPPGLPRLEEIEIPSSSYRVPRTGPMDKIEVKTKFRIPGRDGKPGVDLQVEIEGAPKAGWFTPTVKLSNAQVMGGAPPPWLPPPREDEAVAVSPRGIVLNPLHPVRKISDLREGQRWTVTVLDPLGIAPLLAAQPAEKDGADPRAPHRLTCILAAQVLPGLKPALYDGREHPCRVIACVNEEGPVSSMKMWVRTTDNMVLKHEAELWGDTWTFLRRPGVFRIVRPQRPARPPEPRP
jgi:hypothetical protein